ncbi:MAG: hypothetical protein KGK03_07580 [Candidatus Omnitrophica bacterium]|nr:hypothetical protein [Candidatus Omnitrophota bacterium]MDE2222916.1 hypothetical protein [Candidatus Omnitrophota bacterium]
METLQSIFIPPAKMILAQVGLFVCKLLMVFLIFILGLIISELVAKKGITQLLKILKLDDLSKRYELDAMLAKGGIKQSLSELIGIICYWLALLISIVIALDSVGLTTAAALMQKVVLFIPNIIVAVFILIVGMFVAVLVRNIIRLAAGNAGISQANLLSNIGQVVVIVFTVALALEQLQIGGRIIDLTIGIILGSFGLGFALAFGLGCKDIVGKSVGEFLGQLKK